MYRRYSTQGNMGGGAMSSTAKTAIFLQSAATIRPYIYDFTFGTAGTPSDSVVQLFVTRFNVAAATLGTLFTPAQLR